MNLAFSIRAGSVLTETEEQAVFDNFFRTETEIELILKNFESRTRTETEFENRWYPKRPFLANFTKKNLFKLVNMTEDFSQKALVWRL